MKALIAVLVTGLLVGCATRSGEEQRYVEVLQSWQGASIDSLTASWGYPSGSFVAPSGRTVYYYERGRTTTMPTMANRVGNQVYVTGGRTTSLWCRSYFEVTEHTRVILYATGEGNDCRAR